MNSVFFYGIMAGLYDTVCDGIYFRNYESSPRKAVLEAINNNDKVLDLCTGTATNAIRIAKQKPETKIVGIDISKDMLRVAKEKVRKQNARNIQLYSMDATKMKFKDRCFDKVIISLVLHELDEALAEEVLREAARVLKDDGSIIVTEWELSKALWRKILFLPVQILEPKPYRTFVKKDLYKYFEQFGLEIVEEIHCDYSKVLKIRKREM